MGQILGMRNEEWVNGCMPGMCMAFAGSNSDVKLNDRLPITELTHEQCCKKQRCLVKQHNLKKQLENYKDFKPLLFDILAATLEREVQLEIWKLNSV